MGGTSNVSLSGFLLVANQEESVPRLARTLPGDLELVMHGTEWQFDAKMLARGPNYAVA